MSDTILVLNAGSSSIKFSLFAERGAELDAVASGQVEAIYTAPRFVAKDADGKPVNEQRWDERPRASATTARSRTSSTG